jgi:hypothetical protein
VFGEPPATWGILRRLHHRRILEREFHRTLKRCIVAGNIHERGFRLRNRWYGDRTPEPLEPPILPGAAHILIVRDGRDVIVSETFHFMRMDDVGDYPFEDHPRMVEKRARFLSSPGYFDSHPKELLDDETWVRFRADLWSQTALRDGESVARFEAGDLDGRVHVVRFEDLHRDTEIERRRIYEFLGAVPDDADPLDELTVPGFEEGKERRPHYRSGKVGQWRRFFASDTLSWYVDGAAEALERHGYSVK